MTKRELELKEAIQFRQGIVSGLQLAEMTRRCGGDQIEVFEKAVAQAIAGEEWTVNEAFDELASIATARAAKKAGK